ncbi:hypothetical protein LDI01_21720 [Lentilactobacillus diolivorans]|uniref:Uncharacterized protein n=1 Tax=Lentilactobacillus diolivorans TaxID=179838 RepID=A0ABQ0XK06_9LACO|nr:hypothetical protein LDI01_21720 [Lentilactobacillus diolivorans]
MLNNKRTNRNIVFNCKSSNNINIALTYPKVNNVFVNIQEKALIIDKNINNYWYFLNN